MKSVFTADDYFYMFFLLKEDRANHRDKTNLPFKHSDKSKPHKKETNKTVRMECIELFRPL